MSFIDPLARRFERFVYGRVCALSELAPLDRSGATDADALACPLDGDAGDASAGHARPI